VIGSGLATRLFADGDPVGRGVRAGDTWFLVVGVLEAVSRPSSRRQPIHRLDANGALIVPLGAMDLALGSGDAPERVQEIAIRATASAAVERLAAAAAATLARRHPGAPSWEIVVPRALLAARLRAQRTFGAVLAAIGGLALVISGVGIMNIMLASVAERTHEIGVRRAFGARRRDIVGQFAVEAALLCLAGGAAGVPAGALLALLVALAGGWPVAISGVSILLALGLAALVGLAFGIYPARLAARLDPVVALRAD
jgi:putative ABC transport system permease protein